MTIVRFRVEAEAATREDVEEDIERATKHLLELESSTDGEWECTDDEIIPVERDGEALMYARRVFRRHGG